MREPMDQNVVLLSGPIASGKTTLASLLADRSGFCVVSTRELLLGSGMGDRRSLQAAGAFLDGFSGGMWVRDGLLRLHRRSTANVSFVVDSVRTFDQIWWVRNAFGSSVQHVHLIAALEVLSHRYGSRSEGYRYEDVSNDPVEQRVNLLEASAGLVLDTESLTPELVLERVVDHLHRHNSVEL